MSFYAANALFVILMTTLQAHSMSCDVVVAGDTNTVVPPRLTAEQKYNESVSVLAAALKSQGDQTRNLLEHLRKISRGEVEAATRMLANNAQILMELKSQNESRALLQQTLELLQKIRAKEFPESRSLISFGKNETVQTANLKVQQNIAKLEQRAEIVSERVEILVETISKTTALMRQLAGEMVLLNRIIENALVLSQASSSDSVELPHYILGARDQVELLDRQFAAMKEQIETMEKELALVRPEEKELSHFQSVQLPMLRPQQALTSSQSSRGLMPAQRDVNLTPEQLKDGYRTFVAGDHVRLLDLKVPYKEHFPNELMRNGIREATIVTKENGQMKAKERSTHSRYWTQVKNIIHWKVDPVEMTWGLVLSDGSVINSWGSRVNMVLLANPEISIGSFKVDDVITVEPAHESKIDAHFISVDERVVSYKSEKLSGFRRLKNSKIKLQILGTRYFGETHLVAVKGGYENPIDGQLQDPFFFFMTHDQITGGFFQLD